MRVCEYGINPQRQHKAQDKEAKLAQNKKRHWQGDVMPKDPYHQHPPANDLCSDTLTLAGRIEKIAGKRRFLGDCCRTAPILGGHAFSTPGVYSSGYDRGIAINEQVMRPQTEEKHHAVLAIYPPERNTTTDIPFGRETNI
jgi:hypothetical protein